ncbi:hypothetical protein HDV63DRAFT_370733 [Trichoderma sp. SZMC 28014]
MRALSWLTVRVAKKNMVLGTAVILLQKRGARSAKASTRHCELGGLQCASQIVHCHIAGSRKTDPARKGPGYIHARMDFRCERRG